jgi:hypothetical protein
MNVYGIIQKVSPDYIVQKFRYRDKGGDVENSI